MTYNFRLISYLSVFLTLAGLLFLLPQEKTQTQQSPKHYPQAVLGTSASKTWSQTSFTGGINSGPYTIPWGSIGGWSNYSSESNTKIDSSGVASKDGNPAELISSIFDLGNYRSYVGNTYDVLSVRGASTSSGVTSASWINTRSQTCPLPYRYIQYKITLPVDQYLATYPIGSVTFTGSILILGGKITDASNGQAIAGATVEADGSKATTEAPGTFGVIGTYSIPIGFITDGTANVKVSSPGYTTVSKSYPMSADASGCSKDITANIALTKISTSNPTTSTVTPAADTSKKLTDVALPKSFIQAGSSTTDLSKVADIKNVPDFTLEVTGKNKIKFKDSVDLSSEEATTILTDLGTYVKAEKPTVVEIDSKKAAFLNKRASIVMYNLTFDDTPKILVDGKINSEVVTNIQYKNKILSFDVAHFTKFEAVEAVKQTATVANSAINNYLGFGLIFLGLVTFGAGYYFYGRRDLVSKHLT